ncbi:MAG: type 1 glutamine amidotransferase [Candidatus Auribacter fodinae]|jgi:GMP synthase-like glutamine amidotransferase|uniref:Type 1 glutamine amidotransferase n=1 Tax=Candidatus Auribacter fodinae TaxID=2093366 RepID=A0A3A4R608_9BACT|nr:MAG: type 1 glutamine amidotransferase [Candidatus Auribacter fodinae]
MRRLHYFQHIKCEGLGFIQDWASSRNYTITKTTFFSDDYSFPSLDAFDWLVIMGGPMNVDEDSLYPWLIKEKQFIASAIRSGKTVIGVCLGAQLIARALGAKVYRNKHMEIGWFPVEMIPEAMNHPFLAGLPSQYTPLHWHGDTFDLPEGATRFVTNEACRNQGFVYGNTVIGLQFHLEFTPDTIKGLINHCGGSLPSGSYVQDQDTLLSSPSNLHKAHELMSTLLGNIEKASNK